MSKPHNIILGGWCMFSEARNLNKKEVFENFEWMESDNAFWYADLRVALDKTPGSREFLQSLKPGDSHTSVIIDSLEENMSTGHSGASSMCLIGSYRSALRDWDTWVLSTKKAILLREYKKKQISLINLIIFYNHLTCMRSSPVTDDEGFKKAMEKANVVFSDGENPVEVAWDGGAALKIIVTLLEEMRSMKAEEDAKWKAKLFKERIEHLSFNYKHPSRWFWAGEHHPRYSITVEEMAEMEKLYSDYRVHIALVCDNLCNFGYHAGWEYSTENSAILYDKLVKLGIVKGSA